MKKFVKKFLNTLLNKNLFLLNKWMIIKKFRENYELFVLSSVILLKKINIILPPK